MPHLPIRPGARVLITGPGADNMAMQAGGWTITWQGTDTKPEDFPNGQTIGRAIAQRRSAPAVGRRRSRRTGYRKRNPMSPWLWWVKSPMPNLKAMFRTLPTSRRREKQT